MANEPEGGPSPSTDPPSLFIPEIRDYQKINAELVGLLDLGHPLIRLEGADGQRLLASGLSGDWAATVEIIGRSGPEVAANLDAPNLKIIAHGDTLDGAGRGLRRGQVLILGSAGDACGACQSGGMLVVTGSAGHRAGLNRSGGVLAILGPSTGRLPADRQSGGIFFGPRGEFGPHPGRGSTGGSVVGWTLNDEGVRMVEGDEATQRAWREVEEFLGPDPGRVPKGGSQPHPSSRA